MSPNVSPCHPASGKGASRETLLGCLCHLRAASHLTALPPPVAKAEQDLFRHGGREKERDGKTLGVWAGSRKRQKEGLLTLDCGSCFDFATINQEWWFGSSLWSFGMSLLLFQRWYQARKCIRRGNLWGYSHLPRHLALLTYTALCKKGSWNHVGWKGSLEVIQSQLLAQTMSSKFSKSEPSCWVWRLSREGDCPGTPGTSPVFDHLPLHINK